VPAPSARRKQSGSENGSKTSGGRIVDTQRDDRGRDWREKAQGRREERNNCRNE
jgi:hypothetical protein